jgi:hypothetical protein
LHTSSNPKPASPDVQEIFQRLLSIMYLQVRFYRSNRRRHLGVADKK